MFCTLSATGEVERRVNCTMQFSVGLLYVAQPLYAITLLGIALKETKDILMNKMVEDITEEKTIHALMGTFMHVFAVLRCRATVPARREFGECERRILCSFPVWERLAKKRLKGHPLFSFQATRSMCWATGLRPETITSEQWVSRKPPSGTRSFVTPY